MLKQEDGNHSKNTLYYEAVPLCKEVVSPIGEILLLMVKDIPNPEGWSTEVVYVYKAASYC